MTARDHALIELDAKRLPHWPSGLVRSPRGRASDPLRTQDSASRSLDHRDVALAEQLTLGVVKNLLLLGHLTSHYSGRNLKSIDPLVQKIVAIGLYQLRFLSRVPASAAVDEAVKQAKHFGRPRAAGFVNAVLRNATREPNPPLPPRESAAEYARIVLSHPPELFRRLETLLGAEDALKFCEHDQLEPPTIMRLGVGVVESQLETDDVSITPHEQPGMWVVEGAKRSLLGNWARRGLAQVQDPTAAAIVPAMDVGPGQIVLDRCCGLGTKTLQLRDRVGDGGQVYAIDASRHRVEGLRSLVATRGLTNVHAYHGSWLRELAGQIPGQFERVLIDVPCSNSGVLARRPEARYNQGGMALQSLTKLQDDILDDTAPALRPGGLLAYGTCSVWPEENQERVRAFLGRHPEYELLEERSTLPSFDPSPVRYRDGGYYALLRRTR